MTDRRRFLPTISADTLSRGGKLDPGQAEQHPEMGIRRMSFARRVKVLGSLPRRELGELQRLGLVSHADQDDGQGSSTLVTGFPISTRKPSRPISTANAGAPKLAPLGKAQTNAESRWFNIADEKRSADQ